MPDTDYFLSVDFDFFPAMPRMTDRIQTNQGDVAAGFVYDWGQSETGAVAALQDFLWHERAASFDRLGLDLEKEFAIRPDRGSTTVDEFLAVLNPGEESRLLAWYPSHVSAFPALRMVATESLMGLEVWHFDAHHDLGYGREAVERMRESGNITCEDWLLAAVEHGYASSVHVVYPDWRGMDEWNPHDVDLDEARGWLTGFDIQVHTWSEVKDLDFGTPAGQFLARSDSWTPPYLDPEFERLAKGLGYPLQLPSDPPDLPLVREWSKERVEEAKDLLRRAAEMASG